MSESIDTIVPGTILADRYEIHEPIGHGGFGTVYRARQLNIDRDIAVKVLPQKFLTSTEVVERFRREAQLASRLRHPHTITIHDYGRHDDYLFIAMELLEGEDLADVLHREGTLSTERIVHIATQALKSLSEAHDHGIVHRDLKPENIFLSIFGQERDFIKVLDFGIAKFGIPSSTEQPEDTESSDNPFRKNRQLTISGSTVGTPIYMSPEQAAGEEVDALTDLYSLGIIMYEMASGRPPFYGENPIKIMRSHLFEPVQPFKDPALRNSPLERIILKALDKEKDRRYQNAGEFLAALSLEMTESSAAQTADETSSPLEYEEQPPTLEMFASSDDSEPFFNPTSDSHAALRTTEPELVFNALDAIPFTQESNPARESVRHEIGQPSNTSSILTVLDTPSPDSGEILLLTRPKITSKKSKTPTATPVQPISRSKTPSPITPGTAASPVPSFAPPPQAQLKHCNPTPKATPQPKPTPGAEPDGWNWRDVQATPNTQPATPKNKQNLTLRTLLWPALILILLAILAAAFYPF